MWFPDWPVTAAGFSAETPAAVVSADRVVARTPAAATEGVVIGQRRRQAQRRCPNIELIDHDPDRAAREFEPIVRAVAELSPRFDVIEPGWISLAARGPSRYFGGDLPLAEKLLAVVMSGDVIGGEAAGSESASRVGGSAVVGGATVRPGIGIADGRFASSVAARLSVRRGEPVMVEPGEAPAFCADLPIGWLQTLGESDPELVELFTRLGLRRLGDLAELSPSDVIGRFGHPGVHAHRLASGADVRPPSTTDPAPECRLDQVLDDPAAQSGAVIFTAKQL
ncbi:MAG: DNA polymerase Y family protein, partial [Actinobacteria bacterium]